MDLGRTESVSACTMVANCPVFAGLGQEAIRGIASEGQVACLKKGSSLWQAGASADRIVLVTGGLLGVATPLPTGQRSVVDLIGPSEIAGLSVAIGGTVYALSCWSVWDSFVISIPVERWVKMVRVSVQLRNSLAAHFGPRLLRTFGYVSTMAHGTVEQRMAFVLVRIRETGQDALRLSHSEWAELSHTTVESAIRTTSKWQRAGLVTKAPKSLRVLRWDQIESLAKFAAASRA